MSLIRIKTVQAHPVPRTVGSSRISWDPGLANRLLRLPEQEYFSEFPVGATVQNNMEGVTLYSCDACKEIVAEPEIPHHDCGYIPDEDDELGQTDDEY